jgi:hypothetical protein
MPTIHELKELEVTETPLLLFECQIGSGATERWSTHKVEYNGQTYAARVVRHNLFEVRAGSEDGVDLVSKLSVTLANVDSRFSEIEHNTGWKGARLTVRFVFFNLRTGNPASTDRVMFRGIASAPEEITESTLRLSFSSRNGLQRMLLPTVRVQRRCPWVFPSTQMQRADAAQGGEQGRYSIFYGCGYAPDSAGGCGNLNGTEPFTTCNYTKSSCEQRGMFRTDSADRPTRRFGGVEFVPPVISVRSYGEKGWHTSEAVENEGRYNDFVPLVYGTAWYTPPIIFARNDGNLTHLEVLLGMGEIQGVLKVLVNDIDIPVGQAGTDMTATGWFNVIGSGSRTGAFNEDFLDPQGNPAGDPYGSMAVLSVVVPNRIEDGKTLPRIEVLLEGLKLARYAEDGSALGETFTNNPAWVMLDVLHRAGWKTEEIHLGSFARTAAHCDEPIQTLDLNGNQILIPRHQCNLFLRKRRSAADVLRGIRNASALYLTYGEDGKLELFPESTLATQNPSKPAGSNAQTALLGGWPAYEFGDGTYGSSGILRRDNGEPSLKIWSRGTADTPNRASVEFQDAFNEYQQDSISLANVDDVVLAGQEVSATLAALGIPNMDQAARAVRRYLDKAVRGNTYAEFETSVRGVGLKPGDIITLTYLKEGYERQPFRVTKIVPGANCRTAKITAQIHDDAWYDDANGIIGRDFRTRRRSPYGIGVPRPLGGLVRDEYGDAQFDIHEKSTQSADGRMTVLLEAGFSAPASNVRADLSIPTLSLSPVVESSGGTLAGGHTFYYAISASDGAGNESGLSFVVRATIPSTGNTNKVTLREISLGSGATGFHVYRGKSPMQLARVASDCPSSTEFTDNGLASGLDAPPDENFDHANFYWRLELQPESGVTIHGPVTIGNESLEMLANELRGAVARVTRGKGAGQERGVLSNTATTLTLATPWAIEPDATSHFVVSESSWRFGAVGRTSPVELEVPNRDSATVHVSGRSANTHDVECPYELSPLTRWRIGGAAGAQLDTDRPGLPTFGLIPSGRGMVELAGVAFEDLANTRTISAGTLSMNYWDELGSPTTKKLAAAIGEADSYVDLNSSGGAQVGDLVQVGSEILVVEEALSGGTRYKVKRGAQGSIAESHAMNAPVYHLVRKIFVLPFSRDFFGSPSSGSYSCPIYLPDARVASAELFVTNTKGNSPTAVKQFTGTTSEGLRTLSGGQICIQVEGFLAIQSDAAPALVVDTAHSMRDVFAVVGEAPTGAPIDLRLRQGEDEICRLTIPAGGTQSNVVDGFGLAPLQAQSRLGLDILSVGQTSDTTPGRDLTVIVRL